MFHDVLRLNPRLCEGVSSNRGQADSLQSFENSQDLLALFREAWSGMDASMGSSLEIVASKLAPMLPDRFIAA
jgi:hypothetical protein